MPRKPSEKQTLAPIPEKPEHLSEQSELHAKTPEQRKKRSPKTYSFRKSYASVRKPSVCEKAFTLIKTPEKKTTRKKFHIFPHASSHFFRRQLQQRTSVVTIPNSQPGNSGNSHKQAYQNSIAPVQASSNVNFLRVHWRVAACDAINVAKCIDRLPMVRV